MANKVNDSVLILTETFSCTISVSTEEIIIKKPTNDQQAIEQLIISAEQRAYQEALAEYNQQSSYSNSISNMPGFAERFQQKLDKYMAQFDIKKVMEEDLTLLSLVSPFTSGLNINTPILYQSQNYNIIYARGTQKQGTSSTSYSSSTISMTSAENLQSNFNMTDTISSLKVLDKVSERNKAYYYCPSNISGFSINDNGISFNISSVFNSWNKTSIKH
ncbi:hypothetical protein ACIQXI_18580 [Lysinibacillus sp. NPDC097195]|uniref:hypothetical protein n=1 Tax=Lysinibacillus sp. NPDC097195 TaxID=3364141 RepID=UPI0037FEAF01